MTAAEESPSATSSQRMQSMSIESRVTALELFFDLVFVFALTQVTALLAADTSTLGLVRGLLVLALIWWCWVGFAWLSNVVKADEGLTRVIMFAAMTAMFILALCVPEAYLDAPGGLTGPVVLAGCYLVVRLLHFAALWVAAAEVADGALRRQLLKFLPSVMGSSALLLLAANLTGPDMQNWLTLVWVAVVVVDYGGTILAGSSGWRLSAPAHFAERHGLVIIVALGESIVSIGVAVAEVQVSIPIIVAAMLGLIIAGCIWWAYFDVVARVAESVLTQAPEELRSRLARDAYSYLHLPMVAGIVLLALGLKKIVYHVGQPNADLLEPLKFIEASPLYGGVALYLLAHLAFRWRNVRTLSRQRLIAALAIIGALPLTAILPALGSLGLLTFCMVALISYEAIHYAEFRAEVRRAESDLLATTNTERPR
jgi:low temperature requirement protein LtrA